MSPVTRSIAAGFVAGALIAGASLRHVTAARAGALPLPSGQPVVLIKDFAFAPSSLVVKAGTSVTWLNLDDEPHNVIADGGLFRSGGFDTHERFSYRFEKPGIYRITCSIHPRMLATITVE